MTPILASPVPRLPIFVFSFRGHVVSTLVNAEVAGLRRIKHKPANVYILAFSFSFGSFFVVLTSFFVLSFVCDFFRVFVLFFLFVICCVLFVILWRFSLV